MSLELDHRALLLDALRAPAGMQLAAAVGTTFTLDLTALLAVPTAASLDIPVEEQDGRVELLESIRSYAARTVLFCQAGAISVPQRYRAAHTLVEQTVVEIKKPKGGIFHPKYWVLRYEGSGRTVHRVLVLSRNLTFDQAFDIIVRLDEDPSASSYANVRGLVKDLRRLPGIAARPLREDQAHLIEDLANTVATARLAVPEPYEQARFVPGHPGLHRMPFHNRCDNALAVSPFLTGKAVERFVATAEQWSGVLSRRSSLNAVAQALEPVSQVLRVKDAVLNAQESVDSLGDDSESADTATLAPRGLHAKLYVQDVGETSTTWIGSANLTDAGFGGNHEMLVELRGPLEHVGIDAVLDPNGQRRDLSALSEPHEPEPDGADAEVNEGLDDAVSLGYELASRDAYLTVTSVNETYTLSLALSPAELPEDVSVAARPLSLSDVRPLVDGKASWTGIPLQAITPFIVLRIIRDGMRGEVLLRAALRGDPEHRRAAVIAHAIATREDFFRYLAALLGYLDIAGGAGGGEGFHGPGWIKSLSGDRVLEDLLNTVARAPDRLQTLQETLVLLDKSPATQAIVPEDFRALWEAVRKSGATTLR